MMGQMDPDRSRQGMQGDGACSGLPGLVSAELPCQLVEPCGHTPTTSPCGSGASRSCHSG